MVEHDPRIFVRAFEVHYWPAAGRVLLINIEPAADGPVVTDLRIAGGGDEAAFSIALALVEAGDPTGDPVRHNADGSIEQSLRGIVLRRCPAAVAA